MQLLAALRTGLKTLRENEVPSATVSAELLLTHVLQKDRAYLYTHSEHELTAEQERAYFNMVYQRSTGKPTQYITGHQEFWGMDFEVTPDVLIPRPETELIIETVLHLISRHASIEQMAYRIADVGTGSSCISAALAKELPQAEFFATDISPAALEVAIQNARRLGFAERIRFFESDLLKRLLVPDYLGTFDFIVSNPPYVAHNELDDVEREVRDFEPRLAWGDLSRGEEIYSRLFPQAVQLLKTGGFLVVEIGYNQKDAVLNLLGREWRQPEVRPDLAGFSRVIAASKDG